MSSTGDQSAAGFRRSATDDGRDRAAAGGGRAGALTGPGRRLRSLASRLLLSRPNLGFEEARKRWLFGILIVPGIGILFAFGIHHLLHGNLVEGILDSLAGAWLLLSLLLFRVVAKGLPIYRVNTALLGLLFVYLATKGGVEGNKLLWVFAFPLVAFYTLGKSEGLVWTAAVSGLLLAVLYGSLPLIPVHGYAPEFKLRFCAAFFLVSALSYIYESVRERSQLSLEGERNKLAGETGKLAELSLELQAVNRALTLSEERLKRAQAIAHVGNLELDVRSRMVWASEEGLRILGLDPRHPLFALSKLEPLLPDFERQYQRFEAALRDSGELEFEVSISRASDGTAVPLHAKVELASDADGTPRKIIGVIQDVSERMQAEVERRALEEKLIRSQKMEALGLLAGGVAHDLNNVLSGIVSLPDVLLTEVPPGDPLVESLAIIRDSGKKAGAIVQDLLTLARRGVPGRQVVKLNDIVREYLASPQHEKVRSAHPGVVFESELDLGLLNVRGSPLHLRTSVMNLVANAAEAMPAGGRVHLRTENRYVDRAPGRNGDVREGEYAVLEVADEGVGISPEDLDRIWEPFYTRKKMGRSGTGLGLAIVWGTVQDHLGHVHVDSAEGRGTSIELYFPITRDAQAQREGAIPLEAYLGRGETILVVDDVPEQRELATRILTKLNYRAHAAEGGEAAVALASSRPVDLLVLDMIMDPGIDGLETYARILEIRPEQRAIIVSGYSETDRVQEALRLGASGYVRKPYTLETLGLAVREALDRKVPPEG